ncbi:hypothetical protein QFZ48_002392 [Chitinophaga sp. W2I13]
MISRSGRLCFGPGIWFPLSSNILLNYNSPWPPVYIMLIAAGFKMSGGRSTKNDIIQLQAVSCTIQTPIIPFLPACQNKRPLISNRIILHSQGITITFPFLNPSCTI